MGPCRPPSNRRRGILRPARHFAARRGTGAGRRACRRLRRRRGGGADGRPGPDADARAPTSFAGAPTSFAGARAAASGYSAPASDAELEPAVGRRRRGLCQPRRGERGRSGSRRRRDHRFPRHGTPRAARRLRRRAPEPWKRCCSRTGRATRPPTSPATRSFSHGTAVASVAAGADSGGRRWGVAPGANVRMFAIRLGSGTRPYRAVSLTGLESYSRSFAGYLNRALAGDVDVLNASLSIPGVIDHYSEADLRARIAPAFVQAAAQSGVADKTILVLGGRQLPRQPVYRRPELRRRKSRRPVGRRIGGAPEGVPELRGHWIAAVAVDRDGGIAGFSNRCGSAASGASPRPARAFRSSCTGIGRTAASSSPCRGRADGTSLAAPMIAGGLAVMKQIFRGQLSGTALVSRLFATARKTGRYADRSVYGQGLMDLGAATAPVGAMTIAGGGEVEAGGGRAARDRPHARPRLRRRARALSGRAGDRRLRRARGAVLVRSRQPRRRRARPVRGRPAPCADGNRRGTTALPRNG